MCIIIWRDWTLKFRCSFLCCVWLVCDIRSLFLYPWRLLDFDFRWSLCCSSHARWNTDHGLFCSSTSSRMIIGTSTTQKSERTYVKVMDVPTRAWVGWYDQEVNILYTPLRAGHQYQSLRDRNTALQFVSSISWAWKRYYRIFLEPARCSQNVQWICSIGAKSSSLRSFIIFSILDECGEVECDLAVGQEGDCWFMSE